MPKDKIKITKSEYSKFTSYKFYTELLSSVSEYYRSGNYDKSPPVFSFEEPCFVDPPALPLIMSLGNYLKLFHKKPIELLINNVPGTASHSLTKFLDKSDFFYLVGNNENPTHPIGRKIFSFNSKMLGGYFGNEIRPEHKVQAFSKNDINILGIDFESLPSNDRRDMLIQHFSYVIDNDFREIFEENDLMAENKNELIDCLAELITNSLLHSDSDCYASLHTNSYRTAISISDIGKGLYLSLVNKTSTIYYTNFELYKAIRTDSIIKLSEISKQHTYSIFEALYYSCLQERKGLFDLICSIVLESNGTFRIHNYSTQLIISSKLNTEFKKLSALRKDIYGIHWYLKDTNNAQTETKIQKLKQLSQTVKSEFLSLINKIMKNYSTDMQLSPIRFFDIEFKGVHIETEIPRIN